MLLERRVKEMLESLMKLC